MPVSSLPSPSPCLCPLSLPLSSCLSRAHALSALLHLLSLSIAPFLPPLERQGNETAREQREVSAEHQLCTEEVRIYCKWDNAGKFIFIQITVIVHYSFPCKHLASVVVMRCHYLPDYVIKLLTRQARRATIQGQCLNKLRRMEEVSLAWHMKVLNSSSSEDRRAKLNRQLSEETGERRSSAGCWVNCLYSVITATPVNKMRQFHTMEKHYSPRICVLIAPLCMQHYWCHY